jgi:hypothetical protein
VIRYTYVHEHEHEFLLFRLPYTIYLTIHMAELIRDLENICRDDIATENSSITYRHTYIHSTHRNYRGPAQNYSFTTGMETHSARIVASFTSINLHIIPYDHHPRMLPQTLARELAMSTTAPLAFLHLRLTYAPLTSRLWGISESLAPLTPDQGSSTTLVLSSIYFLAAPTSVDRKFVPRVAG